MNKQINYGLNWEMELREQQDTDYIFGATAPLKCLAEIPPEAREKYLPEGEKQNIGSEKMDCATRGPINILETKFNWLVENKIISENNIKWLKDNGYILPNGKVEFSDRFISILSGTTPQGNSLKAPIDTIHRVGLIPKAMFSQVPDFDEYYNPENITDKMKEMGLEFLKRLPISYERVFETESDEVLKEDMVDTGGYAWPEPINGEYPRSDNQPNHCFVKIKLPRTNIFDNYLDREIEGDFIKKLAENYSFLDYGYHIVVSEKKKEEKRSWWQKLLEFIKSLF